MLVLPLNPNALTTLALVALAGALVQLVRQSPPLRDLVFGALLVAICTLEYRPSLRRHLHARRVHEDEARELTRGESVVDRHATGPRIDVIA